MRIVDIKIIWVFALALMVGACGGRSGAPESTSTINLDAINTACSPYLTLFIESENPSRFVAQAEQESLCNPLAESPFAVGLMQFTPQTAEWAENSFCRSLGKARLTDSIWSAKCGQLYMVWLENRTPTNGEYCDTKKNAERSYNGGLGYLKREAKLTSDHSYPGLVQVCLKTGRAKWACNENTRYADHISHRQPKYAALGGYLCV